jgi:CRP-like cAMP-binding protein
MPGVKWRLLEGVPEEDVRQLLSVARRRTFRRGEVVFHRDDPGDSVHLIVSGRFAVRVMTPLGEPATIAVRGPGDSFGEMALAGPDWRRSATIEALEDAETFSVYAGDFEQLRSEFAQINQVLIAFLANEVKMLDERLLEALYLPAERRVLRRVVELAELYGSGEGPVEIQLTQEALAELAGTSRPTVNQVLREEQDRGTLELRRGRTIVLDLEALAKRSR